MRKETINTFSDGMSLDLNPLGTPAKTLTNCLNGTLITYNGNELTLQNDMGNVPVGTAALPKGYVPIGMKEHGGIIYVASYNPETKKGQLGCFPSPLQIYTSEAALTTVDINLQSIFIDNIVNNIPFIKLNEYKEEIFKDSITQLPKIFNSGDLFIIKTDSKFSDILRLAIDENIIVLKLYIYPIEGGDPIDITNCNDFKLNTYEDLTPHKNIWIFQNVAEMYLDVSGCIPFDELINNYRQYLLTYPRNIGPGILQLVIEFNTFRIFNLYNKIHKESDSFNVLFIGVASPDDYNSCYLVENNSLIPMTLVGNITRDKHVTKDLFVELPEIIYDYSELKATSKKYKLTSNLKLFYDILPASKWGADYSFLKSGTLSYNEILNYLDKVLNWNFEINKSEAIIKWRFLHISEDIEYIRFVFIPLDKVFDSNNEIMSKGALDSLYTTSSITENSLYIYKLNKPYFSGDFEDSFPIDSEHLLANYIYLCRIDVIYKNGEVKNGIDYKLLYTGTFFNTNDITQFNYDLRPEINITLNLILESNLTLIDKNYTIINEIDSEINSNIKDTITPNDFMFLANKDYTDKLIGAVENVEYEVTSNISIDPSYSASFNDKLYSKDSFAGNIEEQNILHIFENLNRVDFKVSSDTEYIYDLDGDTLIEQCKKEYIELEEINGENVDSNPIITFSYNTSGKYENTSKVKIHRGVLSRLGLPEDKNVIHQGLYPVYEPENVAYNNQLFGFKTDDSDFIYNCLLFKHNGINNYIRDIGGWAEDSDIYPFSENAIVLGNNKIIDQSTEYDKETFEQSIANMGNKPINICVTNEEQYLYDDFDLYGENEFLFQLTMPHEISFNETSKTGRVLTDNYITEQAERFKEEYLGYSSWRDRQAFFRPQTTQNCMSISWKTQYGHRLINIATPLDIENDSTENNVITIEKSDSNKFKIYSDNKKHTFSNMHLRAEKLLFCMLSLILIAKCKNDTLRLNAPDILYKTDAFNNELVLDTNKVQTISMYLNGKSVESAINGLLQNNVLDREDIFTPKFKVTINKTKLIIKNTLPESDLVTIMTGVEYPYFSSITEEQIKNIYPGKITSMQNLYICQLDKNEAGVYKINEDLVLNGKFYKIFLPTLISESNVPGKKFNCTNTDTYKFILEGCAYNDILLPATKIFDMQGKTITKLRSQDSLNPQFNLLYYNAAVKQKSATGAVTLFGDLSAFVDASNFTNPSSFKMDTDLWKNIDLSMYQEIENTDTLNDI